MMSNLCLLFGAFVKQQKSEASKTDLAFGQYVPTTWQIQTTNYHNLCTILKIFRI